MRILIITQIYLPEMGALSNRLYPIVNRLAAAGHEVTVATGMPNYPTGKVFPGYRGKLSLRETTSAAEVIRTAYYTVPRNRSKITQLLSYLCFMPAVLISALRAGKVDVVFVTSPPTFPVIPAVLVARLRGARLVLDVRDIWSDELVSYGESGTDSLPVRMARFLERWGYKSADLIGCTTNSLVETVVRRGASVDKTFYFPNGADLDLFKPVERENPIADGLGLGDRFVVMYSGLFGIKHGLEVLLEAAKTLSRKKDIVFLLIGNGARRDALDRFIRDNGLTNVIIAGERPIEDIPHILARADACFAACRPEPYPKKLISVKVFEYLACERAVVGSFEGESARIIYESGGGIVVPPGDAKGVADAVLRLYKDAELRRSMGAAGRKYVERNFSRNGWADRFEKIVSDRFDRAALQGTPIASSADANV
jgi:glycosyltransferase involved in cell wall biosynthesis